MRTPWQIWGWVLVKLGQIIQTDRTLAAVAVTQIFLSVHCDKRTCFWVSVSFCSRAPRSKSIWSFQMQTQKSDSPYTVIESSACNVALELNVDFLLWLSVLRPYRLWYCYIKHKNFNIHLSYRHVYYSGQRMWIKMEAIIHNPLPQAKQFDNLFSGAHASFMTCRFKWALRVMMDSRLLCIVFVLS